MSEQVKVAVVYYSSTGTVYELAKSIVEGAEKAGPKSGCARFTSSLPTRRLPPTRAGQATRPRRSTSPKPLLRTSSGPTR